ncbi:hypothetical protein SUGI_0774170 [Cryptomeria japonica]|nr:hypothetical protein SUGI_0774170 [Cryptomeria japonica]
MIMAILSAIPIYYMSCYSLSCKAAIALDGLLKKFLWEGAKDAKRIPLLNWDTACMTKVEGAAGLRHMKLQNLVLGAKLVWMLYRNPNKGWCKMTAKYLDSAEPEIIFTMANSAGGSPIWKFVWDSQRIIIDHLSWKIGNDKKAKFWRDSWNDELTLFDMLEDKEWMTRMEVEYGLYMVDYVAVGSTLVSSVTWKSIGERSKVNNILVEEILKGRKVFLSTEGDSVMWCATKSGKSSVKLGYELQWNRQKDVRWLTMLCWDKCVLPKARAFLWIALHGKVLTCDRLKTIGISRPSRCELCKQEEENVEHLMYNCRYTGMCWDWLMNMLQLWIARNQNFKDFISTWLIRGKTSKWGKLWLVCPSMVI